MQDHYPIRLLEENATLPDQAAVLERFRELITARREPSLRIVDDADDALDEDADEDASIEEE